MFEPSLFPMRGYHITDVLGLEARRLVISLIRSRNQEFVPLDQTWKRSRRGYAEGGWRVQVRYENGRKTWLWPDQYSILSFSEAFCSECGGRCFSPITKMACMKCNPDYAVADVMEY